MAPPPQNIQETASMVGSVAGDLPEQVKNNQSVNLAAGNGGQKMSQYSWFTVYGGTKPRVQVIGLKAIKPVKLLDLSGEVKKTNRFIEHLRFAVETEAGKTVREYLLPNYVASCCKEIGIDGIRYRSTGYNCCVLWKDDYFEYVEGSREIIPE